MPIRPLPTFKATPVQMMSIDNPGIGGLVLTNPEYKLNTLQSPYMVNMMYRDGLFTKRYGQKKRFGVIADRHTFYNAVEFGDYLIYHVGPDLFCTPLDGGSPTDLSHSMPEKEGKFIEDGTDLLYFIEGNIYRISGDPPAINEIVGTVRTGTIPTVMINMNMDGTGGDVVNDFNLLSRDFYATYHGNGGARIIISQDILSKTGVSGVLEITDLNTGTIYTPGPQVDYTASQWHWHNQATGELLLPQQSTVGTNNYRIHFRLNDASFDTDTYNAITGADHIVRFSSGKTNRIFVAKGNKIYYSYPYDSAYFPENNFIDISDDYGTITGMGIQYGKIIVFKPKSTYQITGYTQTTSTTLVDEEVGLEGFKIDIVNASIGCTASESIQLVNNCLVWLSKYEGVCMLVSTNNLDERNIRTISENVNRGNKYITNGILDLAEAPDSYYIQSCVYEDKYFLVFGWQKICFMWDGEVSSFNINYKGEADPRKVSWFYFTGIYASKFVQFSSVPRYITPSEDLIEFTKEPYDDDYGTKKAIEATYMTPPIDFGSPVYLKNVQNLYVQLKTGAKTAVDIYYHTNRDLDPEHENLLIRIGTLLWGNFKWADFQWRMAQWADTFRIRVFIKKINMIAFRFVQNGDTDMPITHIGVQYTIIKNVR